MGGRGEPGRRDRNQARFLFLDPAAREVYPEWEARALEAVGQLRVFAGRFPGDRELGVLITDLSARSGDFARIWGSGEVVACAAPGRVVGRRRRWPGWAGASEGGWATPGETGLVVHVFGTGPGGGQTAALARLGGGV
ncbi:hypothetical protein ACIBFB_09640 [Nocardiopsis sp. NPDC050513]|uniref:MmyB family transcriptional regulator n=1 Tax=Nocardiopsis sp. NPDC050513 TaxID=3364338 RepID=UPI0037B0B95D